jgi:DNA-binding transcriptional LysR family regulator
LVSSDNPALAHGFAVGSGFIELGYFAPGREGMGSETLMQCRSVLVRSSLTPAVTSLPDLADRPHILVPFGDGAEQTIDRELAKLGLARTVAMSLSSAEGAAVMVADSERVLVLPDIEARALHDVAGLTVQELPAQAQVRFDLRMAWPESKNLTPGQAWFREQIRQRFCHLARWGTSELTFNDSASAPSAT